MRLETVFALEVEPAGQSVIAALGCVVDAAEVVSIPHHLNPLVAECRRTSVT